MLYIKFGCIDWDSMTSEYIHDIDGYFDGFIENDWTDNDWAKRVIKEIDKSILIAPKVVDSPFLGNIRVENISGGAKMLIMVNVHQDVVYDGDNLGDNCWPLFLELCKSKDIQMTLSYYPEFNWPEGCEVTLLDDGSIVKTWEDFRDKHLKLDNEVGKMNFQEINWPLSINRGVFDVEFDF